MRIMTAVLGAGVALSSFASPLQAQVRAEVVLDRDGLRDFHLAIGQRYGTQVHVIERHVSSRLYSDEIPVVYFLAREARVSPQRVISLRERGWSWIDITHHLRVNPRVYVAHLPRRAGPPYGKAHGHWSRPSDRQLRRLSDRQIVDYVNLAFWADYHARPVHEIVVIRERHGSWVGVSHWNAPRPAVRTAPVVVAPGRAQPPAARAVNRDAPQYKEAPAPGRGAPANRRAAPRGRGN